MKNKELKNFMKIFKGNRIQSINKLYIAQINLVRPRLYRAHPPPQQNSFQALPTQKNKP